MSVVLTMPGEWFHGQAPGAANSGISILTSDKDYDGYSTLSQGIMASSVGQPAAEFSYEGSYLRQANTFLAGNMFEGSDLNTSYTELNPYREPFIGATSTKNVAVWMVVAKIWRVGCGLSVKH